MQEKVAANQFHNNPMFFSFFVFLKNRQQKAMFLEKKGALCHRLRWTTVKPNHEPLSITIA